MPKLDIEALPIDTKTPYPPPFDRAVYGRERRRLGNAAGLNQFGVNLTTLHPGAASALRHWHANEDELVFVLEGEVILVEDDGETLLKPGDAAGFKANSGNGHHLVNGAQLTRSISKSARAPSMSASNIRTSTWSRYATITAGVSRTRTAMPMGERRR